MPRKTKDAKPVGGTIHESPRENGISETALKGFVSEYESELEEINKIMSDAAIACQPHKDQMKEITKAAAEAGCPKKVFKAKMRERGYLRRAEGARDILSDEQREIYDEISKKLGPLGEWAKTQQMEFA